MFDTRPVEGGGRGTVNLEKCPWCGVPALWTDPNGGKSGYAKWGCGSYKAGREPTQSQNCRISELEAIVDNLPKNGSGTPVVPGSQQWFVAYTGQTVCEEARRFTEAGCVDAIFTDGVWKQLAQCYDTPKEAEAAEAAGGNQ